MSQNMISLLNAVKGAAASILWALYFQGAPVRRVDLITATGYKKDAVGEALRKLVALGLVERLEENDAWQFTGWPEEMGEVGEEVEDAPGQSSEPIEGGQAEKPPPASIIIKNRLSKSINDSIIIGPGKAEKPPPAHGPPGGDENGSGQIDPALKDAFDQSGLVLNARTRRLAALPHMTPEYVRAHHLLLAKAGKGDQTGLLITILESGLPAPRLNPFGHLDGCKCAECRVNMHKICWYCDSYPCVCKKKKRGRRAKKN